MAIFGLSAIFGAGQAVDVAGLPPPHGATAVASPTDGDRALDATVTAFARGRFTLGPPRYFRAAADTPWQMTVKLLAEEPPLQGHAKRVRFGWERPGLDLVEVFDTGSDHGVAVAMAGDVIGYYPVTFDKTPREYRDPRRPG